MESVAGSSVSRRSSRLGRAIRELDAFPKVLPSYKETSSRNGLVSIVMFCAISVLVLWEFRYYRSHDVHYTFGVDDSLDPLLDINLDIVFATPCQYIGGDVLDASGASTDALDVLKAQPVHWRLSPRQLLWFEARRAAARAAGELLSLNELTMYKPGGAGAGEMPEREDGKAADACRVHGTLQVERVSGNLHFTLGKPVNSPLGHAHDQSRVPVGAGNFTHRIQSLSFGPQPADRVIWYPLDGVEKVTEKALVMFHYFVNIVPTTYLDRRNDVTETNQFSVTEMTRPIDHSVGSHGVAGVFIKYEIDAIKVYITDRPRSLAMFCISLCGIVGGVFVLTGLALRAIDRVALVMNPPPDRASAMRALSAASNAAAGPGPVAAAVAAGGTGGVAQPM